MFNKITEAQIESVYVQSAADKLSGTAQDNKKVFDKLPLLTIESFNALIDEIVANGATNISVKDYIGGTEQASTVTAQLVLIAAKFVDMYSKSQIDGMFDSDKQNTVSKIEYNKDNGSFTVTKADGNTYTIDTDIEKIPVSVELVEDGEKVYLKITNYDGSYSQADVTKLLNIYNVAETDTINLKLLDGIITATLNNGSVKLEHLASEVTTSFEEYKSACASYALSAETNATNASASAATAKTSETNAKSSETMASASATAAKTSETNAKSSETKAKTSETNAATSETNAKTSETNASTSETKAKTSETNAATSESHAKASETNAASSEANAKAAETNAKASETNAAASAVNAATSATNAKTSETNAKTSESNAAEHETKASSSATASDGSATTSKSWAVGGTGTRTGEDTNNAKYWSEQAKSAASGEYLPIAGGTLKGELFLADVTPTADNSAVSKKYVDENTIKAVEINLTTKYTYDEFSAFRTAFLSGTPFKAGVYRICGIQKNSTTFILDFVSESTSDDTPSTKHFYKAYNTTTQEWASLGSYTLTSSESPAFTGTPTAPTAAYGDSSTQIATTAFTSTAITFATQSIETALAKKADSSDVTTKLAAKADLASPALTGTPTAPTADAGTSTTQLATTAFVANAVSGIDMSTKMDKENPVGTGSFAMNMAEGATLGTNAFVEGEGNTASGNGAHAEGINTTASGVNGAHAEGWNTKATQMAAHAEGWATNATGFYGHAEGTHTTASGSASHAEGNATTASGDEAHVEGYETIASGSQQHVQGRYNIEDSAGTYAHIVGNGEDGGIRSNAHTLDWKGNAWYAGKVTVGAAPTDDLDVATKAYVDGIVPSKISNQSGTAISVWTGTAAEYDEVTTKDANTLYFITA